MILSVEEIRKWREVIDESLLMQAEETIDNIVSKYPKTKRVWDVIRDDSFMASQWDMADYMHAYLGVLIHDSKPEKGRVLNFLERKERAP